MFKINSMKKVFFNLCLGISMFCLGIICLNITVSKNNLVFADEQTNSVPYFSATNSMTDAEYFSGDTIFLNSGQTLDITFGKPVGQPIEQNIYTEQSQVGDYALQYLASSFSLIINGTSLFDNDTYFSQNKIHVETYRYAPTYDPINNPDAGEEYEYFYMSIDLTDTVYFPTGEYEISFFNYVEHSGSDFAIHSEHASFTVKFYIFNTGDYFLGDYSTSPNVMMENTRQAAPSNGVYRSYHFFNYTNYGLDGSGQNYLPCLKYDFDKFNITITKTYKGISQSLTIDHTVAGNIIYGPTTTQAFVEVVKQGDEFVVMFYDLGEYKISYEFVFFNHNNQVIKLTGSEINSSKLKQDIIYVYGYQLSYFDNDESQTKEFKEINNFTTGGSDSADVSYLLPYTYLTNSNIEQLTTKTDSGSQGGINIDETMKDRLTSATPASTNQPVISADYNVKLQTQNTSSYYYTWDTATNNWSDTRTAFNNNSFADSGKYLLKVVYTFENNLENNGNPGSSIFFAQFFYFEITNTTATVSTSELIDEDNDGNYEARPISTNAFTQNNVKVSVSGQSKFNSDVKVEIYSKLFGTSLYKLEQTIFGTTDLQEAVFTENLNYKVVLKYEQNKSQTSYFTIDTDGFNDVRVVNVHPSESTTNYFTKESDSNVQFFTQSDVAVEWAEKPSGASSYAYYKYIPFKEIAVSNGNFTQFINTKAIATKYALNYTIDTELSTARYYNSKNYSLLTDRYIFSEQGLYIIQLTDEAGNWQYITFCIDKTNINIWQCDAKGNSQSIHNYNVISADAKILWGDYKLISSDITSNQVGNIADPWLRDIITSKLDDDNDNDLYINEYDANRVCLSPEISSTCYIQTNNTFQKYSQGTAINYFNIILQTTIEDYTFVKEATYTIYLIDEGNKYFSRANNISQEEFVNNANKTYSVTTTSDSSQGDILINASNATEDDYSGVNFQSHSLAQTGFTDARSYQAAASNYNSSIDLRSKYYSTTGIRTGGDISLLTFKINLNPSDVIYLESVVMYHYSFITTEDNVYKLSDTASRFDLYLESTNTNNTTALTGDFSGFSGYNINPVYNTAKNIYETQEGKYVIVRTYKTSSQVDTNDFVIREFSFIVDRQNIVSSPVTVDNNDMISIIGQHLHINVLDGDDNVKKFDKMYMAYNTDNAILSSNKLPVVLYIPVAKYGQGTDTNFLADQVLKYYYSTVRSGNDYLINRYSYLKTGENNNTETVVTTQAIIEYSYFGNSLVTTSFDTGANLEQIYNRSFDLTVTVEYSTTRNGVKTIVPITLNGNSTVGYFVTSTALGGLTEEGFYHVTVIQNNKSGVSYPNTHSKFEFNFEIISEKPNFDFTNQDEEILNTDNRNISYTNQDSVFVTWTDPASEYLAKINKNNIYYYTNNSSFRTYVNPADIVTDGRQHTVEINLSGLTNGTILNVYMEYEGKIQNNSSHITKSLYIDRIAPTTALSKLIEVNKVNGISVASSTRQYVTENDQTTTSSMRYNIPVYNTVISKYAFLIEKSDQSIIEYLTAQQPKNGYYTEGYYYYAKQITIDTWTPTAIKSARNPYTSHSVSISTSSFAEGSYYEIIEKDLAGNITIFALFFASKDYHPNKTVLTYERAETDLAAGSGIVEYGQLQTYQEIFAKNFFKVNSLGVYNYKWLSFSVDGKVYLSSPLLEDNTYYSVTNWIDITSVPQIVTLEQILSFNTNSNSRSKHNLTIVDGAKKKSYVFDISVTDLELQLETLPNINDEGLIVTGKSITGGVSIYLSSIKIASWNGSMYVPIYEYANEFVNNVNVSYAYQTNKWTFTIKEPVLAYEYVLYDNYGVKYVFYHTVGKPTIDEPIQGHLDTVVINDNGDVNTWYVGNDLTTFSYSCVDYYLYLKTEYLVLDDNGQEVWTPTTLTPTSSRFGDLIVVDTSTLYYQCVSDPDFPSINILSLKPISITQGISTATGGVVKHTITLININKPIDSIEQDEDVIEHHILINNLTPIINLYDKNNVSKPNILLGETLFSGQLTIRFGEVNYKEEYSFQTGVELTFTNTEGQTRTNNITSGTVINDPGSYIIKTFMLVNGQKHYIKIYGFTISASTDEFFSVMTYNEATGVYDIEIAPTGTIYEYNNQYFTNHYIVNSRYQIRINEEQDITATEYMPAQTLGTNLTTYFYHITNRNSTSTSINYYSKLIAITYITTESLITSNSFYYTTVNVTTSYLTGTSTEIVITDANQEFSSLQIAYNSYYGIKENTITPIIYYGENLDIEYHPTITALNSTTNILQLQNPGLYAISFVDKAGNTHIFHDTTYNYNDMFYSITFINGVSFYVNGETAIQNAIYNDEVKISLPKTLNSLYDAGGKPKIVVTRNGEPYSVSRDKNGEYTIKEPGYYSVHFTASIGGINIREEKCAFTIINKNEYRWAFEYSPYANYEITEVIKDGLVQDYSAYFDKSGILISLFDKITGPGAYQITIATNGVIANQTFTFNFEIKGLDTVPLTISLEEGKSTTDVITVSFNAYNLFSKVGQCSLILGPKVYKIDQAYLDSLGTEYYVTLNLETNGTHFIQLQNDSGKVLYSYKVIKTEPLNALSIILIVVGSAAVVGITVTIVLLRKRMRIK